MTYRRRTRSTRPWKGRRMSKTAVAGALQRKALKRYNWVEVLDNTCSVLQLPPRICMPAEEGFESVGGRPHEMDCLTGVVDGDPAAPVRFEFVAPATPAVGAAVGTDEAYEHDDITVVRIVGGMWLMPYFTFDADAVAILDSIPAQTRAQFMQLVQAQRSIFLRGGLKKDDGHIDLQAPDEYLFPSRDPWFTDEWTDGRYIKIHQKERVVGYGGASNMTIVTQGSSLGCCANVVGSGGGTSGIGQNTFVDGTGTINIDAIEIDTTCDPCPAPEDAGGTIGLQLTPEKPIYLGFNMRRRLRFRENQGLNFWMNYASPDYRQTPNCPQLFANLRMGVGFLVRAHIKMLVET